jgi:hypothetical protein
VHTADVISVIALAWTPKSTGVPGAGLRVG